MKNKCYRKTCSVSSRVTVKRFQTNSFTAAPNDEATPCSVSVSDKSSKRLGFASFGDFSCEMCGNLLQINVMQNAHNQESTTYTAPTKECHNEWQSKISKFQHTDPSLTVTQSASVSRLQIRVILHVVMI